MTARYKKLWSRYTADESGMSFMETAFLFPVLITLMMAVYDLGQGVVINQKTVAAAQIIGDLVTRNEEVDMVLIEDIIRAGEFAFDPYSSVPFAYDIASVEFDEEGNPITLWRVSEGMAQDNGPINSTIGLGAEGEGVVVVSVNYEYVPYFSSFVVPSMAMNELAFLRGRKSAIVTCADCD